MITIINRTRIINWIAGLKPNRGYKGYTWELLSKQVAVEYDDPTKKTMVYSFLFYDKDGVPYKTKRLGTDLKDKTPVNDLAKAIIDFNGGFYIEE